MGCSASNQLAVEPLNGSVGASGAPDHVEARKTAVVRRESQSIAPIESEEPQEELLDSAMVKDMQTHSNGMSFELAFEPSDESGSIILKHPPKRFQKLEDQQTSPTISLSKLQEKLDEAEIRRQQILQQRIRSAKVRKALRRQDNDGGDDDVGAESPNHLQVPDENLPEP